MGAVGRVSGGGLTDRIAAPDLAEMVSLYSLCEALHLTPYQAANLTVWERAVVRVGSAYFAEKTKVKK